MKTHRVLSPIAAALLVLACDSNPPTASTGPADPPYDVLVFSKTAGFRHDSIPAGLQAIRDLGNANNFAVTATEDANAFSTDNLARFEAVVFLSTTGDVLDSAQQTAFESYIRGGGGYVGVHSAADTEHDWPFYGELVGADGGGTGADQPHTWCQTVHNGRSFSVEDTQRSFDPAFRDLLLGGLRYAANRTKADCRPETGYTALYNGSIAGWSQAGPGSFTNGDATLRSVGGMGLFWYSAREFRAYSLKLDWRMAGDDNSGVFVGFPPSPDPNSAVRSGYEVQIDATDSADRTTGAIYAFASADLPARDAALNPPGAWNTFEILVEGERLRVFLNGVAVNDFTNTDPARSLASGHVGIQNHGAADEVSFRDIRIKELGGVF